MNTQPNVFTPAKLGPVTLRNRIIKAATFEASTPNALVTDDLISYHRLPAAGGVGMTTVAYLAVSPGGRTEGKQIWWRPEADPRAAPADRRHPRRRRRHQRADRPRRPRRRRPLEQGRRRSRRCDSSTAGDEFAKKATRDDIADVIDAHATAARFAIEAGFDAVEIHLGHNYFASSFLSPLINRRDDEFGGSLENRAKVARGMVIAVRRAVEKPDGQDRGDRQAQHGRRRARRDHGRGVTADGEMAARTTAVWTPSNSPRAARWSTRCTCSAATRRSRIRKLQPPLRWGSDPARSSSANTPTARHICCATPSLFRAELKMPLILLGGITNRETMDLAMAEGFDFVAMGRALLAEPDLINRIQADGDAHPCVSCTHCNECMATIYSHTHCVVTGSPGLAGLRRRHLHRQQRRRAELKHRLGAHELVRLDDEFLCGDCVGDTVFLCEELAGHGGFGNDGEHRVVAQSGAAVFVVAVAVHADRDERLFGAAERDRRLSALRSAPRCR